MKFSAIFSVALHVCTVFGFYKLLSELHFLMRNQEEADRLHNDTVTDISKQNDVKTSASRLKGGSSVWCSGSTTPDRVCKFRNLCYHPVYDEYIFFHGAETVLNGVPLNRFNPALLELSTVADHNIHYFNFVDFPASSLTSFGINISFLEGKSFLFHRFMPDNIMHVIHDDLLPLYYTLKKFSFGVQSVDLDFNLIMMEGWDPGPYFQTYKLFTDKLVILKRDIDRREAMTCFENVVVGIDKFTTWYQYGFRNPQGPLKEVKLQGQHIVQFTTFIRKRLGLHESFSLQLEDMYVVLVSRNQNRLILNEVELAMAIVTSFNLRVVRVSMETHSFKEQVAVISKAKGLVGVHGSILIMSMFLPKGAFVIELFPYAINAENYTPYKTLLNLPLVHVVYSSWQNMIEENTITHPNDPSELGGIIHLSKEEQKAIKETKEIPKHLCCKNPYWLYRIYQDTIVDIKSFLTLMERSLKQSKDFEVTDSFQVSGLLYPGAVLNVTCYNSTRKATLWLSWQPPWNTKTFDGENLKYEVWIQKKGEEGYKAYILSFTEHVFTDALEADTWYHIWVRCIAGSRTGPFGSVTKCRTQ